MVGHPVPDRDSYLRYLNKCNFSVFVAKTYDYISGYSPLPSLFNLVLLQIEERILIDFYLEKLIANGLHLLLSYLYSFFLILFDVR